MFNKVINTHVPFKTVSKRKAKQLSKPWIAKGIRKSIKINNSLNHSNFECQYRLYIEIKLQLSEQSDGPPPTVQRNPLVKY